MNFGDLIVDGVKLSETDFSKFTRLGQLQAWRRRVNQAFDAQGWDDETRWAAGDYRDELVEATRDRLLDEEEERKKHCPPRNLDFRVTKYFELEHGADERYPDMENLGANWGRSPNQIVWDDFKTAEEMTNYEFAAYETMGEVELERQEIETLHDLFGTEFANRFYKRKAQLNAQHELVDLYLQRAQLNETIAKLEVTARG